jgi:predicted MPP superfamily phosphohydrolase
MHLRGSSDQPRLRRLVEQANAQKPDLIALTGDIVDGPMSDLRKTLHALGSLRARDGVWLVLGNHEYYAGAEACLTEFRRLGITVLLDEHRVIERQGARLIVAGVTNPQRGMHGSAWTEQGRLSQMTADPRVAFAGAPKGLRLLLAHQPKSVAQAAGLDVSVALTGHSHGGQFFPWNYLVGLVTPYATGLSREHETWVYVSTGLGTFGPKQRLGSPSEMTVFALTR